MGAKVEFLCLDCGVQGLCSAEWAHSERDVEKESFCPRCGSSVVMSRIISEERASNELALSL